MFNDDLQSEWRASWEGWHHIPVGERWGAGYNAVHDQTGGFGRMSKPSPPWADGVPHRFWDDAEVQAEAAAWGTRWDDRWADDEWAG